MDLIIPLERHIPIFSQLVAEAFARHYHDAEVSCFCCFVHCEYYFDELVIV